MKIIVVTDEATREYPLPDDCELIERSYYDSEDPFKVIALSFEARFAEPVDYSAKKTIS